MSLNQADAFRPVPEGSKRLPGAFAAARADVCRGRGSDGVSVDLEAGGLRQALGISSQTFRWRTAAWPEVSLAGVIDDLLVQFLVKI